MQLKRYQILIVTLLLLLGLAACERSASQAPTGATATSSGSFPLPGTPGSGDVMDQLQNAATQTIMAKDASEATATPEPTAVEQGQGTEPTATTAPTQAPTSQEQQSAAPQANYPTATPGTPSSYTLQRGEHPYCIARRFNVNPDELLRQSGLSRGSTFYAGMQLSIPKTGNKFPANRSLKSHPTNYTVVSGDTIYSIACAFGDADPNAIIAANNLQAPYKLSAGQSLYIP